MTRPVRLRLRRERGFDLQAHSRATNGLPAVNVARPSKWGNPFTIGDCGSAEEAVARFGRAVLGAWSNGDFLPPFAHPESTIGRIIADAPRELRGHNLACWCEAGEPCHADVLLSLANVVDWDDLRGIAPGATGDYSSEAFVRRMRDAEWL